MYNFKKLFTYMVVGALIFGLILSCKNNDKTGSGAGDDTEIKDDSGSGSGSGDGSNGDSNTFKVSSIVGTWNAATAESQVKNFTVTSEGKITMTALGQAISLTIDSWNADKDKQVEQYQKTISGTVMSMPVPFTFTFKSANSCHLSAKVSTYIIEEDFTK